MTISQLESASNQLVESIADVVLQRATERSPDLARAILYCAVPHWFDAEVVAAILPAGDALAITPHEILQYVSSLPFSEPHSTRAATWMFKEDFRANLIKRKEVTAHWSELQSRAAEVFRQRLDATSAEDERRFKDPDLKDFAVELVYHLQQLDPLKAINKIRQICAETLAVWTSEGGRPEVNFCLEFLGSIDWSAASKQAEELSSLMAGMKALSTYDDDRAIVMLYDLAGISDLTPKQEGALRYWAGSTHLRNEGRLAPALQQLEKALQLGSNDSAVHAELAAVHYWPGPAWGRFDLAQEHADQARKSDDISGYLASGKIAELTETYDEATAWYRKAIEAGPRLFNGYLLLSELYVTRGNLDNALAMIWKALEVSPDIQYYALVRSGNAYRDTRRYHQALDEYRKAIAEDPDCIDAYIEAADLHARLWQTTEAEELCRKAVELNPMGARSYASLARLFNQAGKRNKVIEICEQAKNVDLESKEILLELLDVYRTPDHINDFRRVQDQLVRLDAAEEYAKHCGIGDLRLARAKQRGEQRLFRKAQSEYKRALAVDPQRASAYISIAKLAVFQNDSNTVQQQKNLVKERSPWAQYEMFVGLGKAYLENFKYVEAEATLGEAVALAPHRIAGWQALSDLHYQQGKPEEVSRIWSKLVDINPTLAYEKYLSVGNAYQVVANYAQARAQFTQAKELEPDIHDAYLALANLDNIEGRWNDAILNYRLVKRKAPGRAPIIYLRIAAILRNQSSYNEAEKAVRAAIVLDNELPDGYIELARLGVVQAKPELLEESKRRLTSISPEELYDLYNAIADEYRHLGEYQKAEQAYRECKRRDSDRSEAYVGLGLLRISEERYSDAKKWFSRALKKDGTNVEAYSGLCQVYEIEKDLAAFIESQNRIVEFNPIERCNACLAIGVMHERMEQLDEAEQLLRTAIGLSPWRAGAYADLGSLLRRRGKLEEARKAYEEARKVAGISYVNLGSYYEGEKKPDDALEVYRLGLDFDSPEHRPDLYMALASLHADLNDVEQAKREYQEAISLDPTRAEAYVVLAQLLANKDRVDEALEVCRQMAKQPQLAYNAQISIGNLLATKGAYGEAERAYRHAIEIDAKQADGYVELARLYQQQNKLDKMEQLLLRASEEAPKDPEPQQLLAELRERQQRGEEAIKLYRQVVELQPAGAAVSDTHLRIGNLLLAQKSYDEAEQEFQQAIKTDPTNVVAYYNLGSVCEQKGNVDRAIELYRKVMEFEATGVAASAAYVRIGNLLREQKHYDQAAQEFQHAIDSDPTNAGPYYDLGTVYEDQGDTKRALKNYLRATELTPKYRDAYVALGRIYVKRKDAKSVARMARQILKLELDQAEQYDAYLLIADVYEAVNDAKQAANAYREALKLYPKNPEAYISLAQLLTNEDQIDEALEVCRQMAKQPELARTAFISIGNLLKEKLAYDEAARSYRQAITADSKEPAAYVELARLYQQQGKLDEMEKVLDQASATFPNDPQICGLQAQLREQQGRGDEAIRLYRRVVELRPSNGASAEACERIGNLMFKEKRYAEAEHELLKAAQIDPGNADIYCRLGAVYENQGNIKGALGSYIKATEIAPRYGDAYRAISHIYAKQGDTKSLAQMARQILNLDLEPADQYEAHLMIASAYQEAELYEWAIDHLNKAVSLDPERLDVYGALGLIYEIQQRWEKARDVYEKIGQLSPESRTVVHLRLGQLFALEEKPEDAEKEFGQVDGQTLDPNDETFEVLTSGYLVTASLYRKQNKLDAMRRTCAQVLKQVDRVHSPDHNALRHQGLAHLMRGDYTEAVQTLHRALGADLTDVRARLYLAVSLLSQGNAVLADSELKQAIEQAEHSEDYDYAIEEAHLLASRVPELAGAKAMLAALREAKRKSPGISVQS